MTYGHVRDNFLRVMLALPSEQSDTTLEFLVDTGFDGELALPSSVVSQLQAVHSKDQAIMLADGSLGYRPVYHAELAWEDDMRATDILVLEGAPLLGVGLLAGSLLQAEMRDGGEVSIEPL